MGEREGQVPPIVRLTQETSEYAEEKVFESESFKKAVSEVKIGLGAENPEAEEAAIGMIKQGIGMVMSRVRLLPAFSNPESRKEVLEKLKQDKVEGSWVDVLASWDVSSDPLGAGVLAKCREKDFEEMMLKSKEAKTPQEEEHIKLQAKAVSKGQSIIIDFYKEHAGSSGIKKAA